MKNQNKILEMLPTENLAALAAESHTLSVTWQHSEEAAPVWRGLMCAVPYNNPDGIKPKNMNVCFQYGIRTMEQSSVT